MKNAFKQHVKINDSNISNFKNLFNVNNELQKFSRLRITTDKHIITIIIEIYQNLYKRHNN